MLPQEREISVNTAIDKIDSHDTLPLIICMHSVFISLTGKGSWANLPRGQHGEDLLDNGASEVKS